MGKARKGLPKQIYVLIAAALILGFLLRQVNRQTAPVEQSLLEAELIMGIPSIPNLSGWPSEMIQELKRLHDDLESRENQIQALGRLGEFYFINGFMGQARQSFEVLRRLEPEETRWPYLLGLASRDFQDKSTAIEAFLASLALDADYANGRFFLGEAYLEGGRLQESAMVFESLLEDPEWEGWARFGLAKGLMYEERYRGALNEIEQAVAKEPDVRDFHALAAELARLLGEPERAAIALRAYRALGYDRLPFDPRVQSLGALCYDPFRLVQLARGQELEGNLELALALLERALQIDSESELAREAVYSLRDRLSSR